MALCLIFAIYCTITITSSQWINGSTIIPEATSGMAVGYYNNSIFLISNQTLIEFNTTSQLFTPNPITFSVQAALHGVRGNWYTQKNNTLYLVPADTASIHIFDLSNKQFTANWSEAPMNDILNPCITGDDNYLYYMGGRVESMNQPTLQILSFGDESNLTWFSGPDMTYSRSWFGCSVSSNGRLYAISGFDSTDNPLTEVEFISTTDIQNNNWTILGDTLSFGAMGVVAVVHNYNIFVVGGMIFSQSFDQIHIINTLTNSITPREDTLLQQLHTPSVAVQNDVLYVFGGQTGSILSSLETLNSWQYKSPIYEQSMILHLHGHSLRNIKCILNRRLSKVSR